MSRTSVPNEQDLFNSLDNQSPGQEIVAWITLILTTILVYISCRILGKKKEILISRGGSIIQLLFFAHLTNIYMPNLITILYIRTQQYYIVCSPQQIFLMLIHGACKLTIILIFSKTIFMKMKSLNWQMNNIMAMILILVFIYISLYEFYQIVTLASYPRTAYRYLNMCSLDKINYYSIAQDHYKCFVILVLSLFLLNGLNIWGTKYEIIAMMVNEMVYSILKAIQRIYFTNNHYLEELVENLFRMAFFSINCFLFIYLFDDNKENVTSICMTDLISLSNWNPDLKVAFKKFLLIKNEITIHRFLVYNLEKQINDWNSFSLNLGNNLFSI